MKWVLISNVHINMDNVDAFCWDKGELIVFFNSDSKPYEYADPDRQLYIKLCHSIGIMTYEVG